MLLRTRATQVVPVFLDFRRRYTSRAAFAGASEDELVDLVAPLGLRWRGRLLHRLAQALETAGQLPRDVVSLMELPGVGSYAAAAAASMHGDQRAIIIDANVVRLISRLTGREWDGETRRKRWLRELLERLTPKDRFAEFNYALLDLPILVCRPRTPDCAHCPLADLCDQALHSSSTQLRT
ncbi:MAG: hypothetical protein R2706_19715 [Acidimicrobiales bacterium]